MAPGLIAIALKTLDLHMIISATVSEQRTSGAGTTEPKLIMR